ncbi:YqcI/YcgG family protein [Paenibacillus lutrae]|uniref:YqcI/YcgG family protein n=1 Tax=Paenibacillus lutrae TaxID=2078573 RepID=A0A7X3FEW5_9BACL|nr:YqcI/YcgG family protein [Paenibacillus lutrae]MVO98364.1 hypothetical protein [Paenibacillus lutrae]
MPGLMTKRWLDEHLPELPDWQQQAFTDFGSRIADPGKTYPCILGRQGHLTNNLRYGFAADPRSQEAADDIGSLLSQYNKVSRDTGPYASLVVFFETPEPLLRKTAVEDYEKLFWALLRQVHEKDPIPWKEGISQNPEHYTWEFCYGGEPYFAFCATPAHEVRLSRRASCFLIAFQPRWIFEKLNDSTALGRKIQKLIRGKLSAYDSIPAHPSLKWYGREDNLEWKQYFLREDESSPSQCPFRHVWNPSKDAEKQS